MDRDAQGVRVGHVIRGSPADVAGIREGDHVVRVGGKVVASAAEVVQFVSTFAVGDRIAIEFARGSNHQTAQAVLGVFPSQTEMIRMDLVGAPAPALRDTQGVAAAFPSSLTSLQGHVIALDFWATWCGPCRITAPKLDALQARYGAQGLNVLGISTEDPADVGAYAQRMALHYAVGADSHGTTTRAYGVVSLPTLVLIDKRGIVRDVSVGYDPTAEAHLESTIQALLAEAAPAP
jgi:thiol-disulfide isomerase/thioredoxin